MARVAAGIRDFCDLERLFDPIAEADATLALAQLSSVRAAFKILADHPLLGRLAEDVRPEPVLSRGRCGYIATYRWLPAQAVVPILAVRQQREAGCTEDQ